jgi:putative flippase GtrA
LKGSVIWQWVRHHTTSLLSTVVDYSVMIGCVEIGHIGPVTATGFGAACGAVTNFLVNRSFTYRATGRRMSGQARRFILVSGVSLALNAAGEYLFHVVLGLHYMLARVIVATAVSNAWNYPMLRFFVFSARPGEEV